MKATIKLKMLIDLLMTILLLMLMAYQVTGEKLHEWIGLGMAFLWIFRLIAVLIAIYGAVCFYQADIFSYMFLKVEFAFPDYEKSAVLIFTEYMAMMGLWIFIAYYVSKVLGRLSTSKFKRKEKGNEKN